MHFKNPENGYIEEVRHPALWTMLFAPLYFLAKGVWTHAIISAILAYYTYGFSNIVYAFFAGAIIETNFLRKGWLRVIPEFEAVGG